MSIVISLLLISFFDIYFDYMCSIIEFMSLFVNADNEYITHHQNGHGKDIPIFCDYFIYLCNGQYGCIQIGSETSSVK